MDLGVFGILVSSSPNKNLLHLGVGDLDILLFLCLSWLVFEEPPVDSLGRTGIVDFLCFFLGASVRLYRGLLVRSSVYSLLSIAFL